MIFGRRAFNLLAKILEMILYTISHMLIGLNLWIVWEPLCFGTRAIKVWFYSLKRCFLLKKFEMQARTPVLIKDQYFL
jgi:hypothetical protein